MTRPANAYPGVSAARVLIDLQAAEQLSSTTMTIDRVEVEPSGLFFRCLLTSQEPDVIRVEFDGGTIYPRNPEALTVQVVAEGASGIRTPAHTQTTWTSRGDDGTLVSEAQMWVPVGPTPPAAVGADPPVTITASAQALVPTVQLTVTAAVMQEALNASTKEPAPRLQRTTGIRRDPGPAEA